MSRHSPAPSGTTADEGERFSQLTSTQRNLAQARRKTLINTPLQRGVPTSEGPVKPFPTVSPRGAPRASSVLQKNCATVLLLLHSTPDPRPSTLMGL
jgi:hypothetical protein